MAKTIVQELVGVVGLEIDQAGFDKASKNLENVKKSYARVSKAAKAFSVAAAAAVGLVTVTNKLTAENQRMADAVGISIEALEAYGFIAKQAGLNTDNVVDLVEELNNKMGESKGIEEVTAVKEAMHILGLEYEKINKLKPEEQFFRVLDAAQQLGDAQAAQSAADILMGGEANKFIGLLRTQDKGLQQLINDYSALNLLTSEGGDLAVEYNKAFGKLTTVFGSGLKQMSALLGKGLTPIINAFTDWIAKNGELAQTFIKVFSVVIPSVFGIAALAVAGLTIHMIGLGLAVLGVTWPIVGIVAAITAFIAVLALVMNDVYTFVKYGDDANTMLGTMINKVKDLWKAFKGHTVINDIASVISSVIVGIDSMISKLNNLGSFIGSGIFDAVQAVRDFEFPSIDLGFGGGGGGGNQTTNKINNTNNSSVNVNAPNLDRGEMGRIVEQENARAATANSTGMVR